MQDLNIKDGYKWTIVSDKQKGLVDSVETLLPECEHRTCVVHLYKNFNLKHKGLALKQLLWRAAGATRVVDFERAMAELKKRDKAAFEWLASKPPHHWSKSYFQFHAKSDVMLNNMSESFNALILRCRDKSIISMLESIRHILMKRIHVRRDKMLSFTGGSICPKIIKILEKLKVKAHDFDTMWNGDDQFEIKYIHNTKMSFAVDLRKDTCSCRRWELTGIPCPHAICGMWYLEREPEKYVHPCYSKENFLKTYSNLMRIFEGCDVWPKTNSIPLVPPVVTRLPGRPKKHNRKIDPQEKEDKSKGKGKGKKKDVPKKMKKTGLVMTCKLCGEKNHNKRGFP